MYLSLPKKQHSLIFILLALLLVLFLFACKKNTDANNGGQNSTPDFTTKATSSISGFITDQYNNPVQGALVHIGGVNITTDKFGFFRLKNVLVVKNAATVTVNYPGYFKAVKTYIATDNKAAFFRIKLIPKTTVGTIDATSGGNITLANGLSIALPANAVVTLSGSNAYAGTVNVAAHWIDPTATDLNETMPGDLRGIATDGSLKTLTSYGMAAVELTGTSGELLQIAAGKKATLALTIPASIIATAPATIPLWYFDEPTGLWKQEGEAIKTGNTYAGEVSHFSYWNCDIPASYVQFNCTIKDVAGNPVPFALVKIRKVGITGGACYGYTDSSGYVAGGVPENENLLLEVFNSVICGTAVYSQNFSTTNAALSLGTITITTANAIATVSGTVTDCNNAPVRQGSIIVISAFHYYMYPISNTGTFSFNTLICGGAATITVVADDVIGHQQSSTTQYNIIPGSNTVGNIQACGGVNQLYCISTGYFYHPSVPRIINETKILRLVSQDAYAADFGDLGPSNYVAIFTKDASNHLTITAAPGTPGAPYTQFDNGLPSTNPGYTPQWPGASQCNNIYDPAQREFRVRYGYLNVASGWRIAEEIIKIQ